MIGRLDFPIHIFLILLVSWSCTQDSARRRHIYGEVEVDEIDVAPRIPGRIAKVLVQPGQSVAAGDLLIEFEDDVLKAKKERAVATIKAAKSQRDIAEDAVRPEEMAQLQANVTAMKKQYGFAIATRKRVRTLYKEGAVSQQQLEEVEFKTEAAKQKYLAAQAKFKMGQKGARDEQKAGASALVEKAETGLAEVKAYEKDLHLQAPVAGEISRILNDPGELVPTGYPVVTVLRTAKPWVVFYVPETKLRWINMGKVVQVDFPALKETTSGTVSYIAPLAAFATRTFTQDKATFDLKSFEVRVSLNQPPPRLRPGMTARLEQATETTF